MDYIQKNVKVYGMEVIYTMNYVFVTNPQAYKNYFLQHYFSIFNCLIPEFSEESGILNSFV